MAQPHIAPSDVTMDEIRNAIGDKATWNEVEDFLFLALNDDFSLHSKQARDEIIGWYHDKLK